MILSDRTIREQIEAGSIVIDPLAVDSIQPSSVDLRLDRWFRVFRNHTMSHIDVRQDLSELTALIEADEADPFILHPGEFVLGSTLERVAVPTEAVVRAPVASTLKTGVPPTWMSKGSEVPGDAVSVMAMRRPVSFPLVALFVV
ncbi:MAG: 2'-deoxycytidine 5'-triphosphate deaminase domain-containing protein [Acidimicrobiales bacterium]